MYGRSYRMLAILAFAGLLALLAIILAGSAAAEHIDALELDTVEIDTIQVAEAEVPESFLPIGPQMTRATCPGVGIDDEKWPFVRQLVVRSSID